MPVFNRSFLLLFAFVVSYSDLVFGTDNWGSHLQRHACDGNCARRFQIMSGKSADDGNGVDSIADGLFGLGAEDSTGTHLFLSVHAADGVKKFSSGVVRSGKIEYGPMAFEMNSTSAEMPTEFRMLLDGEAAHPELFEAGSEWQGSEQGWSRSVQWNCPPLGRHSIQFEVRLGDRLVTSEQLWIEIVAPLKPEVVAVGSNLIGTSPINSGKVVTIYQDTMMVRFAMTAAAEMIMHRAGLEDLKVQAIDECCFEFNLQDLSVGRHGVKFSRVVGSGCSMTSEPSDTLWIQYEPTKALHSLRNENARRRKVIVDEIRRISASTRPSFDTSTMYNGVRSSFSELNFTEKSIASSNSGTGVLLTPVSQGSVVDSPSDRSPESGDNSPVAPTGIPEVVPLPFKSSQSEHPGVERLVALTTYLPATDKTKDEPSKLLRERAQLDADRLSKFEDDLAVSESVWQANKVVSHVIFDAPAYFTQNGYGTSGQEDARNGLVLLEGMELSTQASGHWELKIPYIKSATPAVLHLQIQFKTTDGYWKPLTLQPICFKAGRPCIDPSDCNCGHSGASGSDQSVRCECSESGQPMVTLKGYSPILRREVGVFTEVRRRGATVFGHGYNALEDRRSF